jgi:Dicarboxylate transport
MRFKVFLGILCLLLLILSVIGQAIFLALPVLVETALVDPLIQRHLPEKLPQGLVSSDLEYKIEKIGLTHTLVSRIRIGQVLSADLVDFQYHLENLKHFQLDKITISGLTLYATLDADTQLYVNGEKFPGKPHPGQADDTRVQKNKNSADPLLTNLDSFLDFLPKKVVLKDAALSITRIDEEILIPFEVLAVLDTLTKKVAFNAQFYPFGQSLKAIISADLTTGLERIKIQAPVFHPEVLSGFFPSIKPLKLSGPVGIDILKDVDTDWQLSLSQVKLDLPRFPGTLINNLNLSLKQQTGKISASGGLDLAGSLAPALGMIFDFDLIQNAASPPLFDLTIKNKPTESIALKTFPQEIGFDRPQFSVSLTGDLADLTGDLFLECQNFKANQGKNTVSVKNMSLISDIKGNFSDKGNGLSFDIQSEASGIKLGAKSGQAEISRFNLTGRAGVTKQLDPRVHLDARINDAQIDHSEFKIEAMGIEAGFPLIFPFENMPLHGRVSVEKILYDNQFTAVGAEKTQGSDPGLKKKPSAARLPAIEMDVSLEYRQKQSKAPSFELKIKNRNAHDIFLYGESREVHFKDPALLLMLKGDEIRQVGNFSLGCQHLTATQDTHRVKVENFLLTSGIKGNFSDRKMGIDLDLKTEAARIDLAPATAAGKMPKGKTKVLKKAAPAEFKMTLLGIHAGLPLAFPFKDKMTSGPLSIKKINWDNKIAASLAGNITQSEELGLLVEGQAAIQGVDGFHLGFNGKAWGPEPSARIDFAVDPFLLMPGHLKKIMPQLNLGEASSIQLSSQGTLEYKHHGLKSRALVTVDDGTLVFPDMNLSLQGIAGSIDFNDLVAAESIPGQMLTIDKVQLNQLEFDTAKARFSIEDGKSVNIENLRFNWCNGLVSTESIRLPGKDNLLSLILYCDRLELSELLKQMGAFHAEGEGTLSGRIPLVYSDGNISFDKGFLFSTPGKGGRVVIKNTTTLTAGIPMDTPEFVQLDLAREALKDFDYQWAKLELNTFEDTLLMNMELDGKPAKIMPFEYQREIGSFVRVGATSPGSRFQGIKLNLNLKLPFNQVIKFGNRLNDIFN